MSFFIRLDDIVFCKFHHRILLNHPDKNLKSDKHAVTRLTALWS